MRTDPDRGPVHVTSLDQEFAALDALSRKRALTFAESYRLERIIKEIDARNGRRKKRRQAQA